MHSADIFPFLNALGDDEIEPAEEVQRRIGNGREGAARGWKELCEMLSEVYDPGIELSDQADWQWSFAPSIILRGEMEMYGQSHPRFAIRLIPFRRNAGFFGFLNLRRIEETAERLPRSWRPVEKRHKAEIEALGRSLVPQGFEEQMLKPAAVYRQSPPIADCLLPVPHRLLDDFVTLKAPPELALACGEGWQVRPSSGEGDFLPGWPNPEGFSAVPYMKHIRMLGAGMCAQAVCFMASALLLRRSKRVHSLAEITRRARDGAAPEKNRKQWVEIAGLNGREIKAYFRHPKTFLNADLGVSLEDEPLWHRDALESRRRLDVRMVETVQGLLALRRYILAEIPVIISVDLDRMHGIEHADVGPEQRIEEPVYGRKEDISEEHDRGTSNHAILVVGVHQYNPSVFLVHDPAKFPFVQMTARQWEAVCPYSDSRAGLETVSLIPVFPSNGEQIRWGLSTPWHDDRGPKTLNLLTFLGWLYLAPPERPNILYYFDEELRWAVPRVDLFSTGFHLDLGRAEDCAKGLPMMEKADADRFAEVALQAVNKGRAGLEHWFWISGWISNKEDDPGTHVFLWDASAPGPEPLLVLIGLKEKAGNWRMYQPLPLEGLPWGRMKLGLGEQVISIKLAPSAGPTVSAPAEVRTQTEPLTTAAGLPQGVELALMTSCLVTDSLRLSRAKAPRSVERHISMNEVLTAAKENGASCADSYCFMHQQVLRLFEPRGKLGRAPALDVLAAAWDRTDDLPSPEEAARKFAASCTVLPVRAFSTFLPEAASEDDILREQAAKALACLLRMARELSLGEGGHFVRVMEVVGGTRIGHVAPVGHGEYPDSKLFPFLARECSPDAALKLFLETLRWADELAGPECRDCIFAIEKEPGDFYTVNSSDALTDIIRLLDGEFSDIKGRTGLNLDIPHWGFLCDEQEAMAEFAGRPEVLSRLVHVHLSDHHAGHFCDLPPGYFRPWNTSAWQPWLALLPELFSPTHADERLTKGLPPFSGVISCEIEAARCLGDVRRTVAAANRMLSGLKI